MCGLAGIVTIGGLGPTREVLARMGASLAHRGPDAEGFFADESVSGRSVGLVHRRLSIIDLSHEADQPLGNEDGSVQVLLNGEIYNFQELRRSLEGRHRFRSKGDTEVIAHLYEERGEDTFAALDGMFAVAIWDGRHRRLVLATDAFGKKPLYYWSDDRRFVFGSEIKALLAADVPAEMAEDHLAEYVAFGYVPTPATLFRGIRKVPPASFFIVDGTGVHGPRRYWDVQFPRAGEAAPVGEAEARDRVRVLLTDAVRKRLVADVPLGLLLSGGLDSSVVAALMQRLVPGRVQTFTVGFEGHASYDERPHAETVARHVGADHHASVVRADAASLVEILLHHHDQPFGDSSALPTYLVAQEARKHVTVVLNGDGGDETFGGYDRFGAALLAERIPRFARRLLSVGVRVLPQGADFHGTLRRLHRFARKAALPFDERLFAWSTFFDLPELRALGVDGRFPNEAVLASTRSILARCAEASVLSQFLYLNLRTYLVDDLLPKMDRMTMAHGLEARSPMLDRALVEYVAALPDGFKRRGSIGKVILREIAADLLPPEILRRRKQGFSLPLGDWFRGELRGMVEDVLLSSPRAGRWLTARGLRALAEQHFSGRADRGHQLWTLLTLELWLRKHRFG